MSKVRFLLVCILLGFTIECNAQTDSLYAYYLSMHDTGFYEMFIFKPTGEFVYKTGSSFRWSNITGHGRYSLNENCSEIYLQGNPVAKLLECHESRIDTCSYCTVNLYIYDEKREKYYNEMWFEYLIINNDTFQFKDVCTYYIKQIDSADSKTEITLFSMPSHIKYNGAIDSIEVRTRPNALMKYKTQDTTCNSIDLIFSYEFDINQIYMEDCTLIMDESECIYYEDKIFCKLPDSLDICRVWLWGGNKLAPIEQWPWGLLHN